MKHNRVFPFGNGHTIHHISRIASRQLKYFLFFHQYESQDTNAFNAVSQSAIKQQKNGREIPAVFNSFSFQI